MGTPWKRRGGGDKQKTAGDDAPLGRWLGFPTLTTPPVPGRGLGTQRWPTAIKPRLLSTRESGCLGTGGGRVGGGGRPALDPGGGGRAGLARGPLGALRGEGGGRDSTLRSLMTQSGPGARATYFPQKSDSGALPPGQPSLRRPPRGPGNPALGVGWERASSRAQPVQPSAAQLGTRHPQGHTGFWGVGGWGLSPRGAVDTRPRRPLAVTRGGAGRGAGRPGSGAAALAAPSPPLRPAQPSRGPGPLDGCRSRCASFLICKQLGPS